jgi:transposase
MSTKKKTTPVKTKSTGVQPSSKKPTEVKMAKQSLGIDVSKDTFDVCLSRIDSGQRITIQGTTKFSNTPSGWKALLVWIKRFRKDESIPFAIVVEATGVYYESLAYYLRDAGLSLSVVLPNKSRHFAKSLNIKTKTDLVDAKILAQMGLERNLGIWQGASPIILKLKRLCRERQSLQKQKGVISNQLHAHLYAYHTDKSIIKRREQLIALIDKQVESIDKEVKDVLDTDLELKGKIENVCTIKGVALLTAVTVVAEADGFILIDNKGQLVSYSGYDVVECTSGTSIKRKTRISKKGNAHIRYALYFPAHSAAIHDPKMKALYNRILEKNPKVKMIGSVAVQRKLLVLIYTLFKNNQPFDDKYEEKKQAEQAKKQEEQTKKQTPSTQCLEQAA